MNSVASRNLRAEKDRKEERERDFWIESKNSVRTLSILFLSKYFLFSLSLVLPPSFPFLQFFSLSLSSSLFLSIPLAGFLPPQILLLPFFLILVASLVHCATFASFHESSLFVSPSQSPLPRFNTTSLFPSSSMQFPLLSILHSVNPTIF